MNRHKYGFWMILAGIFTAVFTDMTVSDVYAAPLSQEVTSVISERLFEHYARENFPASAALTGLAQQLTETEEESAAAASGKSAAAGSDAQQQTETEGESAAAASGKSAAAGSGAQQQTETEGESAAAASGKSAAAGSDAQQLANAVRISDQLIDRVIFKIADPVPMHPGSLVNIRSGPGTNYDVIGTVVGTDKVMARNLIGGWYMVDFRGLHGFIREDMLQLWADDMN